MAKQAIDNKTQELPILQPIPGMANILAAVHQVEREAMQLEAAYNDLKDKEGLLNQMGVIYAGTTMKADKYLYLIYPSQHGEPRVRKYIGSDPKAITETFAAIRRGEELNQVKRKIKDIENQVHNATYQISRIIQAIRS